MKNLLIRTATAGVFVAILLGCTYYSHLFFSILFLIITILGMWEFYSLIEKNGNKPQKYFGIIAGAIIYWCNVLSTMNVCDPKIVYIKYPLLCLIFIVELFRKHENPFLNISVTVLGIIYVVLPFALLNHIVTINDSYSYELMFGIFFLLWTYDAGAYLVGSSIGKHKLFPRISPGKTWEGTIGGAIISFGIIFIIAPWYSSITFFNWIVIDFILIIAGTFGDLTESLLKRNAGVKDSGTLLPGHGGVLDRFDSLMMAIPFIFFYLEMMKLN